MIFVEMCLFLFGRARARLALVLHMWTMNVSTAVPMSILTSNVVLPTLNSQCRSTGCKADNLLPSKYCNIALMHKAGNFSLYLSMQPT